MAVDAQLMVSESGISQVFPGKNSTIRPENMVFHNQMIIINIQFLYDP